MESKKDNKETKRAYEKPQLRTIELVAEEVLAVGCKLSNGGFNFGAPQCTMNNCVGAGS